MRAIISIIFSVSLGCTSFLVAEQTQTSPTSPTSRLSKPCEGGVLLDDGQVDSGYSFVPSAIQGTYVQYFDTELFPSRQLESVCVCWLKTRQDREDVSFEVVFFESLGDRPAREPYAWVRAVADEVPESVETAGEFVEVDVRGVRLPETGAFIGVRWNPSEESFLFLCNDRSETTERAEVFFLEDRAKDWTDVKTARDPIFRPHRAVMVRATALDAEAEAPPPWKPPELETPLSTLTAEPDASSPPRLRPTGG